jgi:cellulose synthase/poly-beta-1,6-N-acetylglucosamine synthase-like glycosyltransferase
MQPALRLARWTILGLQAFLVAVSLYQSVVTTVGRMKGRNLPPPDPTLKPRFGLVVCARNERPVVAEIVRDLLAQDYPRDLFSVVVVAHNCTDNTAEIARAAGGRVIELRTEKPGKAQVIRAGAHALGPGFDYIGVFDADAHVMPYMLSRLAGRTRGKDCIQIETRPREPTEWLSASYGLGRRARNIFWWRPREALGLGTTISGCGFFIRQPLLSETLLDARTLTEDLEITARLYSMGHSVSFVSAASVHVGEPHQLTASVRQRLRWVRGHVGVIRHRWPAMARRGLLGDLRALDIALYMLVPTRVLTRTTVSISFLLSLWKSSLGLPLAPVALALSGEWLLPLLIGVREKLLPFSREGFVLGIRQGFLSLLWFPIGVWALLTAQLHVWEEAPRVLRKEDHAARPD